MHARCQNPNLQRTNVKTARCRSKILTSFYETRYLPLLLNIRFFSNLIIFGENTLFIWNYVRSPGPTVCVSLLLRKIVYSIGSGEIAFLLTTNITNWRSPLTSLVSDYLRKSLKPYGVILCRNITVTILGLILPQKIDPSYLPKTVAYPGIYQGTESKP